MNKRNYRKLDEDTLRDIAAEYKTRREFFDADSSAYVTASRMTKMVPKEPGSDEMVEARLLDVICAHMYSGRFKWTKSMILIEAKKYTTRTDFAKGNKAAYSSATRQGILEEACAHMPKYMSKKQKEAANEA